MNNPLKDYISDRDYKQIAHYLEYHFSTSESVSVLDLCDKLTLLRLETLPNGVYQTYRPRSFGAIAVIVEEYVSYNYRYTGLIKHDFDYVFYVAGAVYSKVSKKNPFVPDPEPIEQYEQCHLGLIHV